MKKILFENVLKILVQFWINCKVKKKFKRTWIFRETAKKFSENFKKKFQIQKC